MSGAPVVLSAAVPSLAGRPGMVLELDAVTKIYPSRPPVAALRLSQREAL